MIAGLGNIYVDEAYVLGEDRPRRPADSLSDMELAALHLAIRQALNQALDNGGTSFRNYLSTWGRKGTESGHAAGLSTARRSVSTLRRTARPHSGWWARHPHLHIVPTVVDILEAAVAVGALHGTTLYEAR